VCAISIIANTVDEHSLRTIEHLQELRSRRMNEERISAALEDRHAGLADLALLLHEVGKGIASGKSHHRSLAALDSAARR